MTKEQSTGKRSEQQEGMSIERETTSLQRLRALRGCTNLILAEVTGPARAQHLFPSSAVQPLWRYTVTYFLRSYIIIRVPDARGIALLAVSVSAPWRGYWCRAHASMQVTTRRAGYTAAFLCPMISYTGNYK
jgi:hypothetical protein